MKKIFPLSLIVIITSALYANAVGGGFLRDDFPVIMENRWITGVRYIPEIFSSTLWSFYEGTFISGPSNYYRPLMHMIYMAGYHIFGQSPAGYHLVNIAFHNLNAVLVFLIASLILKRGGGDTPQSAQAAGGAKPGFFGSAFFPFAAALIFAAHPVNVEAVTWVGAVSELAFTSFCLAAFYLYALEGKGSRGTAFYILSVVFYGLALFTKETAIVLPALLAAYDFAVRKRPLTAAKQYIPFLAVAGVFFYIRSNIVGPLSAQHSMTAYQYLLSVAFLTAQYIEKLVFPFNLKLYYPFHRPQFLVELFSHEVLAALGAAVVLAFSLYRSSSRGRLILCALWVLIPLSPAVLMVKYIQGEWAFASRYLYLSSAGFAILCACWLKDLFEARPVERLAHRRKALMAALALLVIVPFAADTVIAARAWRDEFSYWKKAVEDAPGSPNTHASLGFAYAEKGLYEEAIREYEITLNLAPGSHETYMNLGAAYYNAKKPDRALEMFARALSLSKSEAAGRDIHARMGRIYLDKGMWAEAAQSLEKAVSGRGAGADLYNRLGIAYAQAGRIDMAVSAFREAVALDPGNAGAQRNLQMLLDSGAGSNAAR